MGKKTKEENPAPELDESSVVAEEALSDEPASEEQSDEIDFQVEAEKNKDLYLRALADLENYRKRAQREKEDAIRFANGNLLREMIPVIDNLERAVEHAKDDQDGGLLEGVQMTLEQFRKVLESFGVKAVDSIGSPFDPNFHQAMGEMVTSDHPPSSVVQELQKGYTLNDRLLRPAMVMIAKAPAEENAVEEIAETNENETDLDDGSVTEVE